MVVLAVAVEILYYYNKKNNGFYVDSGFKAISVVIVRNSPVLFFFLFSFCVPILTLYLVFPSRFVDGRIGVIDRPGGW
jgi:hypothetical protein